MPVINPVIVLPGITATDLSDEYPLEPERVWSLISRQFDRVTLHPRDLRYEFEEPARIVPDSIFNIPYGEFIAELRHNLSPKADEPTPVFPFKYDWRQPLESVGDQLDAFIDEVIDRTKLISHYHAAGYGEEGTTPQVNLVGHSLGGIIIAGYIAFHGGGKVGKAASIGSPFCGSHEAVLKVVSGLGALGEAPASSREREAARITPSLYYLLPTYDEAVTAEDGLSSDLYEVDTWQPGVVQTIQDFFRRLGIPDDDTETDARKVFSEMLEDGHDYRDKIDSLSLTDEGLETKDWLCIVGVGEETRVHLQIEKGDDGKPFFNLTSADRKNDWEPGENGTRTPDTGDGTVPYEGASCAFIPENEVVCVCDDDFGYWEVGDRLLESRVTLHALLPAMNLVQRLVVSHFQGEKEGQVWGRPAPGLTESDWEPPIEGLLSK
jgi:pimeloyl-ACP methyl ester carboxylesterase